MKVVAQLPAQDEIALVVDDHPLVARGIASYLTAHCGFAGAFTVADTEECLRYLASELPPRLAVIDFWLPEGAAMPLLRRLSEDWPDVRLLAMSGDDDAGVAHKAREAGAHGFLAKCESAEVFAEAITVVRDGGTWFPVAGDDVTADRARRELPVRPQDLGLTYRQGEILALMLRGLPNKRIARDLGLSEQTVKEHITNVLAKLGVANRIGAITLLRGRAVEL